MIQIDTTAKCRRKTWSIAMIASSSEPSRRHAFRCAIRGAINKSKKHHKKLNFTLFCTLLLLVHYSAPAAAFEDQLVIRRDGVLVWLTVQEARDVETRRIGLMGRTSLLSRTGMLFDFEQPKRVQMWMKNTLISLDILFIKDSGEIVYIRPNTTPQSLDLIKAPQPVRYVLEINAGEVSELGLAIGDRLYFKHSAGVQARH